MFLKFLLEIQFFHQNFRENKILWTRIGFFYFLDFLFSSIFTHFSMLETKFKFFLEIQMFQQNFRENKILWTWIEPFYFLDFLFPFVLTYFSLVEIVSASLAEGAAKRRLGAAKRRLGAAKRRLGAAKRRLGAAKRRLGAAKRCSQSFCWEISFFTKIFVRIRLCGP